MRRWQGRRFLVALEASGLGEAMRKSAMLYPLVETLHIIGFATLVRIHHRLRSARAGVARTVPLERAAASLLPVAIAGFCLAAPMGFLLFTTEATSIGQNPAFLMKMSLLVVAGLNALLFHLIPWRRVAVWGAHGAPPTAKLGRGGVDGGVGRRDLRRPVDRLFLMFKEVT